MSVNVDWYNDNFERLSYEQYTAGLDYCYELLKEDAHVYGLRDFITTRPLVHDEQVKVMEDIELIQANEPNVGEDVKKLLTNYRFYAGRDDNYFILQDRWVVPIRNASGNLISLVGWYPDLKKYVTIPTRYFKKKLDWFNIDDALELSLEYYDGLVFVVEGIFDALSLRAVGLPVIATMGSTVEAVKGQTLNLFNKVVMFSDSDEAGDRAMKFWHLPDNTLKVRLKGVIDVEAEQIVNKREYNSEIDEYEMKKVIETITIKKKLKDPDDLVTYFPVDGVRQLLLETTKSKLNVEYLNF